MNEDDKKELLRLLDQYAYNGTKGYETCMQEVIEFIEKRENIIYDSLEELEEHILYEQRKYDRLLVQYVREKHE